MEGGQSAVCAVGGLIVAKRESDVKNAKIWAHSITEAPLQDDVAHFSIGCSKKVYYTPKDPLIDETQQMELVPHVPFEDPDGKVKTITGPSYQFESEKRLPRINRYYHTLKPFYKL